MSDYSANLKEFDDYVSSIYQGWDIPGLAIAIVKDGETVFAKGYGVQKLGEDAPADENTIFAIGSATKAFTAAAVAMLVDEGKLQWDDLASKYLPDLRFYDPYVDNHLTVRDLLTHRSGLARTDFLWLGQNLSREEILKRVRHIEPASSFRSAFGYQNVLYMAAGQLIPAVTGQSYDDFIHERFFKPLGMTGSSTSITELEGVKNVSAPHVQKGGETKALDKWRNGDNIAPAGSINASVNEMTNWLKLNLNGGKVGDEQLISPASLKELHTPQFVVSPTGEFQLFWMLCPEMNFLTYGLGWFIQDYRGRKLLHHGGNIDGFSAMVSMMPSENLGVVILTSMNSTVLPTVLHYKLHDVFLGGEGEKRDWSAFGHGLKDQLEGMGKEAAAKQLKARLIGTSPSLKPESYTGEYVHPANGKVIVTNEATGLVFQFGPEIIGDLHHWHLDTFEIKLRDFNLGGDDMHFLANFVVNADGKVSEVKLTVFGDFKKTPEPEAPTAEAVETAAETEAVEEV